MAAATAAATVNSAFFHPQHMLARCCYRDASTTTNLCAACEGAVAGTGYRCDVCDFNIYETCLTLPTSISFAHHQEHLLTLIRLCTTHFCNICKHTSDVGSLLYRCTKCDFAVHPRCTSLVVPEQQEQEEEGGQRRHRHGRTRRAFKVGLQVGLIGFQLADWMTGGVFSPVIEAVGVAIEEI